MKTFLASVALGLLNAAFFATCFAYVTRPATSDAPSGQCDLLATVPEGNDFHMAIFKCAFEGRRCIVNTHGGMSCL